MKKAALFLFLTCFSLFSKGQDLENTDLESVRMIESVHDSWRRHKMRDPKLIAELEKTAAQKDTSGYQHHQEGKIYDRRQVARRLLNTYYESYEVSDFKVTFVSKTEAVLTHWAVANLRVNGNLQIKSGSFQIRYKKVGGEWVAAKNVISPTR